VSASGSSAGSASGPSGSSAGSASGPATPSGAPAPTSSQRNPGLPNIPKYELIEEIGHGGMATVYKARDPRLNRDVAVKVIHRHLRENGEVATRFVAEARAAAKLRHPGIVEVYDVSNEEDSERFLVVELLRGTTLRKVLQAHREMPAEVGASIVHELCSAIEHAHESGIIHRDIKPENVLVELPADRERDRAMVSSNPGPVSEPTDIDHAPVFARAANDGSVSDTQQSLRDEVISLGTHADKEKKAKPSAAPRSNPDSRKQKPIDVGVIIKLTDFGIAKILDAQGVTSTGQVLGSPAHMAPEQIEGGDVDARTDVFALGVLMYECLVGHLPFEGKNPAQVLRKVLDGIYTPADRERGSVGGRWSRIIAAALARDAAERTATPSALAEAISAELAALGILDPKTEIEAYFADPKAYVAEHDRKLVPKLLARGEAARKTGDVPKAAADFNRALALRPNDLTILKRVGGLATTANRRILLKRGAMILAGMVVLGCIAFGVTRILKHPASMAESGPMPTNVKGAQPDLGPMPFEHRGAMVEPVDSPSGHAESGRTRAEPKIHVVTPPVLASAAADAGAPAPADAKKVSFNVYPGGAKLSVDGKQVDWQGNVFPLKPGPHSAHATVEGDCCNPMDRQFNVFPDRDEQRIQFLMEIRPATIEARGPAGGTYRCTNNLVGATPSTKPMKMTNVRVDNVSCVFTPSDGGSTRTVKVTINAGVTTVLDFGH
jgi:serine/threonine protein kinase